MFELESGVFLLLETSHNLRVASGLCRHTWWHVLEVVVQFLVSLLLVAKIAEVKLTSSLSGTAAIKTVHHAMLARSCADFFVLRKMRSIFASKAQGNSVSFRDPHIDATALWHSRKPAHTVFIAHAAHILCLASDAKQRLRIGLLVGHKVSCLHSKTAGDFMVI